MHCTCTKIMNSKLDQDIDRKIKCIMLIMNRKKLEQNQNNEARKT